MSPLTLPPPPWHYRGILTFHQAARKKIGSDKGELSAAFWFSSAELAIDPYVAGKNGAPGYIMSALGIKTS